MSFLGLHLLIMSLLDADRTPLKVVVVSLCSCTRGLCSSCACRPEAFYIPNPLRNFETTVVDDELQPLTD